MLLIFTIALFEYFSLGTGQSISIFENQMALDILGKVMEILEVIFL